MPSVEDQFAISALLNRMAYYYDEGHLDELAACFAEDAIMSMQIAGGDMVGPFGVVTASWNYTAAPNRPRLTFDGTTSPISCLTPPAMLWQ